MDESDFRYNIPERFAQENQDGKQVAVVSHRDTMSAIIRTLRHSSESGLNASLSPLDCRILLAVLSNPGVRTTKLIDKMKDQIVDIAESAIQDVADGIRRNLK